MIKICEVIYYAILLFLMGCSFFFISAITMISSINGEVVNILLGFSTIALGLIAVILTFYKRNNYSNNKNCNIAGGNINIKLDKQE